MIPTMMKNMRGLEKAGRFSGGGVGVSMVGWMQICRSLRFFAAWGKWFFQGFLRKSNANLWFLDGENVVRCMVNVVNKLHQTTREQYATLYRFISQSTPVSGWEERIDGASSLHGAEGTRFSRANTA